MKAPPEDRPFPKGQAGFREAAYRLVQVSQSAQKNRYILYPV